jgi:uncharacterized Zn finger protein
MSWYGWRPYVPVAVRRARARKKMEKLRRKGLDVQPVEIEGRKIANTFWGEAWCEHLEKFSDYANRLPRGRTYVRNGSVCHLEVAPGTVKAMVSGSELYDVSVTVKTLAPKKWREVKNRCAGRIGSLIELLQGRLSKGVMAVVTDRDRGLFPVPREIRLRCSCPDWAVMCKHVAAVLYGVGARLDERPELLFLLRGVDHEELISAEADSVTAVTSGKGKRRRIADGDLTDVFGIEMAEAGVPARTAKGTEPKKQTRRGGKLAASKKAKARTSANAALTSRSMTGRAVAGLRRKFNMSLSQFARLLGVSAPAVGNWEKKPGKLNLQARTLRACAAAAGLSRTRAWKQLNGKDRRPRGASVQ